MSDRVSAGQGETAEQAEAADSLQEIRETLLKGIWCPTMGADAVYAAVAAVERLLVRVQEADAAFDENVYLRKKVRDMEAALRRTATCFVHPPYDEELASARLRVQELTDERAEVEEAALSSIRALGVNLRATEAREAAALSRVQEAERALRDAHDLLRRVEPELVPNHDAAQELADKFGLGPLSKSSLIEDIRAVLGGNGQA